MYWYRTSSASPFGADQNLVSCFSNQPLFLLYPPLDLLSKMFLSESRVLLLHPFYIALSFFRWAILRELVCQFQQFLHPPGTHPTGCYFCTKKCEKECILAHRSCLADVKSWNKWRFVRAEDWRISTAPPQPAAPIYQCNIVVVVSNTIAPI